MPERDRINAIVRLCHDRYTYATDLHVFGEAERWADFSDQVLSGAAWRGDCDDLAMTVCSIVLDQNACPPDRVGLAAVGMNHSDRMDHAIMWMKDNNGDMYYADCNWRELQRLYSHSFMYFDRFNVMTDPQRWYAYEGAK